MMLSHSVLTHPFAYKDKLKAEMELLESQHIIAPGAEATDSVLQLWSLQKRTPTALECV